MPAADLLFSLVRYTDVAGAHIDKSEGAYALDSMRMSVRNHRRRKGPMRRTLHARVRAGTLALLENVDLPEGTEVTPLLSLTPSQTQSVDRSAWLSASSRDEEFHGHQGAMLDPRFYIVVDTAF